MAISANTNGFRAGAENSVYLAGKSRYGSGSFLFFDAQASTDPLDNSSCRGVFVDSSNRLSYWNGTSTIRLTGSGGIATTWEDLYANDATFALTTATWTITQSAAADLLTLTKSNVGAGSVLAINNSGSGADILGTSSTWQVSAAGLAQFATNSVVGGILKLGAGAASGTLTSNGEFDLVIETNSGTNSSIITITDGANGNITNAMNGTGKFVISGTTTHNDAFQVAAGDVVVTTGSFTLTDDENAESVTVVNNTATTIGNASSTSVFQVESTSLTTGCLVNLQLTEGTLNGGSYFRCWDATAGAANFTIGEDGATTILGAAAGGTTVFTITKGDASLADGSLTIIDADNAATLSVTNNTVTTADAVVDITSTSLTTGALVRINANTAAHDGEILELINAGDATSTGTGLSVTMPDITTGAAKGISVVMAGATTTAVGITVDMAALTTGTGMLLTSAGTIVTTGELLSLVGNAATTCTGLLRASGTGLTDGFVAELTGGGANATASGGVLNLNAGAATAGSALKITTSGVYAGTTGVVDINAASATTGVIVDIGAAGLTTGTALKINAVEATLTTGKYVEFYDGAANDFSVAKYGATVIAGSASGTAALTLTAGDAVLGAGNLTLTNGYIKGTAQALSGAGAVDVTHLVTTVVTTGVDALTLADGVAGQVKVITMITDGGEGTLTPTSPLGFATIKFNDVGDSVILIFVNSGWQILSNNGCTVA